MIWTTLSNNKVSLGLENKKLIERPGSGRKGCPHIFAGF